MLGIRAKCNRELPCESCIKRGERSTCKYANNAIRNPKPNKRSSNSNSNNVGERLQRVESLLFDLIEGGVGGSWSPRGDGDSFFNDSSQAKTGSRRGASQMVTPTHEDGDGDDDGVNSLANPNIENKSTHWLSILDDIKEVREQLSQSEIFTPEENDMNQEQEEIDLALGTTELPKLQDIIASLPPRAVCDGILSQYFNSSMNLRAFFFSFHSLFNRDIGSDLSAAMVHTIKFQNEVCQS